MNNQTLGGPIIGYNVGEYIANNFLLLWIRYLDDVLCYGKIFDEHLQNIKIVLKLRAEKCVSFKSEIKYLGKIINSEGYTDNPINTDATGKLKEIPKNVGDLLKLLGFIDCYR